MPAAGETVIAGKVPGERIATTTRTSNSSGVTAETVVDTVVAAVVIGRKYKVKWISGYLAASAADTHIFRMREDSISGTVIQFRRASGSTTSNLPMVLEAEYTADATEDKTFVVSIQRDAGTGGTITSTAASTSPVYLLVEYISG